MDIFLVEDDVAIAMGIIYALKQEGYEVSHYNTFEKAKQALDDNPEKIGIFDVMLPDGNGYDLLKYCRETGNNMPVIFLTAMSDELDVIRGLELGADDYIAKPFRVKELVSRINAVSRRYEIYSRNDINYKDILIDTTAFKVYKEIDGERCNVDLTLIEFRLLVYFVSNQGIVQSRAQILNQLFDGNADYVDDNTLSVYIKRLREKIGDKDGSYIKTVRGVGYEMDKE